MLAGKINDRVETILREHLFKDLFDLCKKKSNSSLSRYISNLISVLLVIVLSTIQKTIQKNFIIMMVVVVAFFSLQGFWKNIRQLIPHLGFKIIFEYMYVFNWRLGHKH